MNRIIESELRAYMSGDILAGHDRHGNGMQYMSLDDLKETSVHVLGAAGYGKSYYLRHLIDQFILHRQPFGLIDPHRELYEYALDALRLSGVGRDRIVLLDTSQSEHVLGFNPLQAGGDADEVASLVLDACMKAWGASSFDQTPRLEGILRGVFRLLIESKLTLLDAYDVLNVDNGRLRAALCERVSDPWVRRDFEELEKLSKTDKLGMFESSRNRLRRFLQTRTVQMMLGQTQNTLDLQSVMDEGKHLLVNLGTVSAPETQRLLGALLINGVFHAAKRRDPRCRQDWFLIVDEFGEFATKDFANSLDQLRKFGAHIVVGHQRLRQLEREDPDVLSAVMTNAKIKVVFGGLERPEAERMARELFTGQVRGDQVKHTTMQTKFRPVLDTFEVETESWSEGEGDSENVGSSHSSGESESEEAVLDSAEYLPSGRARSQGMSESSGRGRSRCHASGSSHSVVPITKHEEFQEETGRQFWGIDEEWERLIALVHGLPKREALIRVYNEPVMHVVTPEVPSVENDRRLDSFRRSVIENCEYTKPVEEVRAQIEERKQRLTELQGDTVAKPRRTRSEKPRSFRE